MTSSLATPSPSSPSAARPRRWRFPALSAMISLIALIGVAVSLYPMTAEWFNAIEQSQIISKYENAVQSIGPAARVDALKKADRYNAALEGGAAVRAGQRLPQSTNAASGGSSTLDYNNLLNSDSHGLMGRITIPSIDVDLPIYHGTDDKTLENAVGHLEGTSLPVGGVGTRSVLAGHRGLASATLFTHLDQVRRGDSFTLYVFGRTLQYRITSIDIVAPDDSEALDRVPGRDLVTLVTCTPIGINSERILVTGERVLPTPDAAAKLATHSPTQPSFPWWALIFAAALAAVVLYLWWSGVQKQVVTVHSNRVSIGRRKPSGQISKGF